MRKLAIVLLGASFVTPALATQPLPPPVVHHMHHVKKPPVHVPRAGHGTSIGGAYAASAIGCSSIFLLGGAAYVGHTEKRELTCREANMIVAGCFLPFIGSMLVDEAWRRDPSLEAKCKAGPPPIQ